MGADRGGCSDLDRPRSSRVEDTARSGMGLPAGGAIVPARRRNIAGDKLVSAGGGERAVVVEAR